MDYDVIMIGGGHNGLAAAGLLAQAQRKVLVLERRAVLGGAAATEELFPGCEVDTGAMDAGMFLPQLVEALKLENYGLRFLDSPALTFAPQPDGRALTLWRDPQRTVKEIAAFSAKDAQSYPEFKRLVRRLAGVLAEIMVARPPSIPELNSGELVEWLRPALNARRLGGKDMMALVRILPMPVTDWLDEWFENPAVKAAIGAAAVTGSLLGPRSSGTAFMLLYLAAGTPRRFVQGGAGRLSQALAQAAEAHGAQVRTGAGVAQILVADGRAVGVRLESGEELRSRVVVSSADPRRTFFELVGPEALPVSFVREIKALRLQASLSRVTLALRDLPRFTGAERESRERLSGRIRICPDLDYLERAYDAAKYGEFSPRPYLDAIISTVLDPERRANGGHVMSINVQYTPYDLRTGDWESQRQNLVETTLDTLAEYAPDIRSLVTHCHVLTPLDLEREYGLTRGDVYHGQMGLDQLLFIRPAGGYGRYATPVEGLYLCGAGTHPGGGLTGAPGWNAAREIMKTIPGRG